MNSKLDFLTYFEYRVHAALFRAMEGWLFAKWCWNQHICFTGLSHCVFSKVLTNLSLTRWPEEAYFLYFFLALQRFFFLLSKRSMMTSPCPPLPLPHSLREVCLLNTHENPCPVCLPLSSAPQSSVDVLWQETSLVMQEYWLLYLCLSSNYKLLKTSILLHLNNQK